MDTLMEEVTGKAWSVVFRRSASNESACDWADVEPRAFAVRRGFQQLVAQELDQMVRRGCDAGPGCGSSAYWWDTPWGKAKLTVGWGPGMWLHEMGLLFELCDRLGLKRPGFNIEHERAVRALRVLRRSGRRAAS